jgi:ribosomal protein L31E
MRSASKNTFEKNFFNLMNNSIYGKTMENVRKRVDVKLVTTKDDLVKAVASPCSQSQRIMNDNLVAVKRMKEVLTLNKPCYVGMCILDLSKTSMHDFHYNTIKTEYGNKARLLFTDTDSLTYEIKTDDVYEDFKRIGEKDDLWDNSDYPKDNPYYSAHNKKVIGKLKDEAEGVPIVEFVGLRSKMYSYVKENGKGGMTAKGMKKYVIKNKLTHDHFKGVIREKEQLQHNMNTMRSVKHQVGTYEMRKVTLSCFDDKGHLLNDGITSYAYGHKKISANCEDPKLVRIDPVVEERGPKEVGPIEEVPEHHTVEKLKVLDEPEIRRVPRAKRVKTVTFAEDDEVEVKLEKHWTPKLELVKKRKRKVSEGKCFEVFSEPEINS